MQENIQNTDVNVKNTERADTDVVETVEAGSDDGAEVKDWEVDMEISDYEVSDHKEFGNEGFEMDASEKKEANNRESDEGMDEKEISN